MVIANPDTSPIPITRLLAVDLRQSSPEEMQALTEEAMRRGVSMDVLLGQLIQEMCRRILEAKPQPAASATMECVP